MGQTKFHASRAAKHRRQCSESHCYSGLNLSPEKGRRFVCETRNAAPVFSLRRL